LGKDIRFIKLALVVEYEGTEYSGFQLQPNAVTIQGELETALTLLTSEKPRVYAASRTDAGAHARGQVVVFWTSSSHPTSAFLHGLNFYLPKDIRVQAAYMVPDAFDPRRDATVREYHYHILHGLAPSALQRRQVHQISNTLSPNLMRNAAAFLLGIRDFAPFAGNVGGRSTIRRLDRLDITEYGGLVTLEIVGNAFLPQQIRRMAGALVEVGSGRLHPLELHAIANNHGGGRAGPVLPAKGLCLMQVKYPNFPPCPKREVVSKLDTDLVSIEDLA